MHSPVVRFTRRPSLALQLETGLVELISPLEQPFLDVACTPDDIADILHRELDDRGRVKGAQPLLYTHIELSATAMLSEVAALTPFSDLNQCVYTSRASG